MRLAVVCLNITVHCPLKTDLIKSSKLSLASKIGLAAYTKVKYLIYGPRPVSTIISYGTIELSRMGAILRGVFPIVCILYIRFG